MMKKTMAVLMTLLVLAGCQSRDTQPPQDMDQRKDMAHKLIMKALNDLQNKDLKTTIVDLETSIKVNPNEPEAFLLLGQILLKVQAYDQAASFLDMAAKHFPDNGTIFYMLSISNKMTGKKLPAVLSARRSVEIFQGQQDRDNMLKSVALLHELVDIPDDKFTATKPAQAPTAAPADATPVAPSSSN
ncbi:MAG: tetratricopeptide repeat protein [Candidatus Omnitrophica bacterium]|nr:tetratricopeptide repeat protein [Candidatus Omnitrophota bacterium]